MIMADLERRRISRKGTMPNACIRRSGDSYFSGDANIAGASLIVILSVDNGQNAHVLGKIFYLDLIICRKLLHDLAQFLFAEVLKT